MINKKYIFLVLALLIVLDNTLFAQSQLTDEGMINHQLWFDIYPHFYINDELEYNGNIGYRTILNEEIWNNIYVGPSLRYHISNFWEFHCGIYISYLFNKFKFNRFELTPWQGIKINWPRFERLKFGHMLKLEERISFLTNNWSSSFDFRIRYKFAGRLDIIKFTEEKFWYIPFFVEFFIPVFDNIEEFFRNRGRVGVGIGYNVSKKWQFEGLFNLQTSRAGPNEKLVVTDYAYQIKIIRLWSFNDLIKF